MEMNLLDNFTNMQNHVPTKENCLALDKALKAKGMKQVNSGDKYGRLTVTKEISRYKKPNGQSCRRFECVCECGVVKSYKLASLTSGKTKSCGCYRRQRASEIRTHGMTYKHPTYHLWAGLRARVEYKNGEFYHHYGGRGIRYCDEWKEYLPFHEWALANGWKKGLKLDRIDNDGNYCPENCRFVTQKEQNRNKRNNIKYKGECSIQASRRLGGNKHLVDERIRTGWSYEKAFNTPPRKLKCSPTLSMRG